MNPQAPAEPSDGLYGAMDRHRYESLDRVNWSTLKWMQRSPAHYHDVLTTPAEDTDPKKLGRVIHVAVFEPSRFLGSIAVWDGGVRRGKTWESFVQLNQGKELLTQTEFETCKAVQKAVRSSRMAAPLLENGTGEATILWTVKLADHEIVRCKGRVDFEGIGFVSDLKSTKDGSSRSFGNQAMALGYHVQGAWYTDAYELITGKRVPYKLVSVEKKPPYVVQVYRVTDAQLRLGRETYMNLLAKLVDCRTRNIWPGYSGYPEGEMDLVLPTWAMPYEDEIF